jgi:ABC-type glutathione transport system ATPase component
MLEPGDSMSQPIIEVLAATKQYSRRHAPTVTALSDVSVTIEPGETVGVVGESGSGKTTLMRLVLGLESPTTGRVLFRGQDLATLRGEDRKTFSHKVSAVFQNPYSSLSPRMRIWQAITEQQAIEKAGDKAARRSNATRLLDLVGLLPEMADRYPHQLSGGQRQRVAIARALSQNPDVIVLDEPLSALDVSVTGQVINLLLDLRERLQIGYVFVAHDMHLVRHMCHRVVVLHRGHVVEHGPTLKVLGAPTDPYTESLIQASELESLDADMAMRVSDGGVQGTGPSQDGNKEAALDDHRI